MRSQLSSIDDRTSEVHLLSNDQLVEIRSELQVLEGQVTPSNEREFYPTIWDLLSRVELQISANNFDNNN